MKVQIAAIEYLGKEDDVARVKIEYFAGNIPDEDILKLKIAEPLLMYASLILQLDSIVSKRTGVKLRALQKRRVVAFFRDMPERNKPLRIEFKVI